MADAVTDPELIEALTWRYAVKKFDPTRQISREHWETLLHALRLSPSSCGLQPWKFISVEDKALREKLKPHAHGQSQITDASHLLVFAHRTEMTEADVDEYVADIKAKRPKMPAESLGGYRGMMVGLVHELAGQNAIGIWTSRQLYISLGVLLTSAALLKIDACPMEGFVPKEFDEILGLNKEGYASAVLCTLGYRAADDHYAKLPKVRFDAERVIEVR